MLSKETASRTIAAVFTSTVLIGACLVCSNCAQQAGASPATKQDAPAAQSSQPNEEMRRLVDDYTYAPDPMSQANFHRKITESKAELFARISANKDMAVAAARQMLYAEPNGEATLDNLLALVDKLEPARIPEVLSHLVTMHDRLEPMAAVHYATKLGGVPELAEPMINAEASLDIPAKWRVGESIPKATGPGGFKKLLELLGRRANPLVPSVLADYGEKAIGPLDDAIRARHDSFRLDCLDALAGIKSLKAAKIVLARSNVRKTAAGGPTGTSALPTVRPANVDSPTESAIVSRALANAGPAALPDIRSLVRDPRLSVSETGIKALLMMNDPRAFDDLLAIPSRSLSSGKAVAKAMILQPDRGIATAEGLMKARDARKRRQGVELLDLGPGELDLARFGPHLHEAILRASESKYADVRVSAYRWLRGYPNSAFGTAEDTIAARLRSLRDPDPHTRALAVSFCGGSDDKRIMARIKALAADPTQPREVRSAAEQVLGTPSPAKGEG